MQKLCWHNIETSSNLRGQGSMAQESHGEYLGQAGESAKIDLHAYQNLAVV